jgi:hypothetical protein
VESYIADLVLYMLEIMGADRSAEFKKKHLGFPDVTPKGLAIAMMNSAENPLSDSDFNKTGYEPGSEDGRGIPNKIFK